MNSPNCKQIQAELLDYHEKELTDDQHKQVSEHLAQCENCSKEYEGLRAMLNNAKQLPIEDPGEEFWQQLPQKVLAQVKQERLKMRTAANTSDNIIDLPPKRQFPNASSPANTARGHRTTDYHRDFKTHRLSAALAVAAGLLLLINIMTFSPKTATLWLDQGQFQAHISASNLPTLVHTVAQSTSLDQSARLGFVDQQRSPNAYRVGTWLAETFAYLNTGQYPLALAQLQQLQNQLQQHPVSAVTLSSLRKAEELLNTGLRTGKQTPVQVQNLLSSFQHDYENFLSHTAPQQIVLYRAGIWVFNANLAVAARDAVAVSKLADVQQLDYLQNAFVRLDAPPGVHNTLADFAMTANSLSGQQPTLSEREYRRLKEALKILHALLA
jgi:hypothetical protein